MHMHDIFWCIFIMCNYRELYKLKDRINNISVLKALRQSFKALDSYNIVCLFLEGKRLRFGDVHKLLV